MKKIKTRSDLIMLVAEHAYYTANPNTKMDVPSIVYEQVEKDLGKLLDKYIKTK